MSSPFPNTLPTYDPFSTPITLQALGHTARHRQMEQDIAAIASKVGVDGSADSSSFDFMIAQLFDEKINYAETSTANMDFVLDEDDFGSDSPTKLATQQSIKSYVDSAISAALVARELPVGSLYMNETNSANPNTLLGYGTWVAIQDQMIMAAGSTYPAGTNGGAATHAHPLSDNGAAAIGGTASTLRSRRISTSNWQASVVYSTSGTTGDTNTYASGAGLVGNTDATSSLPPYRTAYVWRRTA